MLLCATPSWATATQTFPALERYQPLATAREVKALTARTLWARVGGNCVAFEGGVPTRLGEGQREGHSWAWTMTVRAAADKVVVTGPGVKHGVDRVGDGRVFEVAGESRSFFAVSSEREVKLLNTVQTPEVQCWSRSNSTSTCDDGGTEVCQRCALLRLVGGKHGGQQLFGDGVIHADLTRRCGSPCDGPGLSWAQFEALAAQVKATPLAADDEPMKGALYSTKAACQEAPDAADLAPRWKLHEPAIPPR